MRSLRGPFNMEVIMPGRPKTTGQGNKSAYTPKQRRQAHHIEDSEMERGASREEAEKIGWATVNKQDGGALNKKKSKK